MESCIGCIVIVRTAFIRLPKYQDGYALSADLSDVVIVFFVSFCLLSAMTVSFSLSVER